MNTFSKILFSLLLRTLFYNQSVGAETFSSKTYIAGAVEFAPSWNYDLTSSLLVNDNLKEYLKIIDEAGTKNVDILVFPEGTLNYHGLNTRQDLLDNAIPIPADSDSIAPCDTEGYATALTTLSCKCKENKIYTLINLVEKEKCEQLKVKCPIDGYNLYNTNVVLDRRGKVVSKYRKFNLFLEPSMNTEEKPTLAVFDTDFGVKFGHFICFDLLFKTPALDMFVNNNVKHFLFSSMWFSETPFLTSTQIQQAWAYENNVVLIAAGANNPKKGSTGSGIYIGKHGAADIMFAPERKNYLMVQQVPKEIETYHSRIINYNKRYTVTELDKVKLLEFVPEYSVGLSLSYETRRICKGKICCEFSLKYKVLNIPNGKIGYHYRMTVFTGGRSYSKARTGGEIHCAIIACTEDRQEFCGKRFQNSENLTPSVQFEDITIKAIVQIDVSESNYLIMPSTLDTTVLPYNPTNFNYDESSEEYIRKGKHYKNYTITTNRPINDVLTFGIYGRNFNLDEEVRTDHNSMYNSYSSVIISNTFVWFTTFFIFFISYKYVV